MGSTTSCATSASGLARCRSRTLRCGCPVPAAWRHGTGCWTATTCTATCPTTATCAGTTSSKATGNGWPSEASTTTRTVWDSCNWSAFRKPTSRRKRTTRNTSNTSTKRCCACTLRSPNLPAIARSIPSASRCGLRWAKRLSVQPRKTAGKTTLSRDTSSAAAPKPCAAS